MSSKRDTIILERRFVPEGTLVMRQGDPGNCAYLIQSGSVRVYTQNGNMKVDLAVLDVGQIFGEMALIFDEPRTASVIALEDCHFIILTRETLQQKLDRSDATVRAIVTMLTQRIISSNNSIMNRKADVDEMLKTARVMYQNTLTSLSENEQRSFQNDVLPKLDEFMAAIKTFQKDHKK